MISFTRIKHLSSQRAVNQILAERFDGAYEPLLTEIDEGLNHLLRTDLKKAGVYLKRAAGCYKLLPDKTRPRFLSMEARLHLWTGDYKAAVKKYIQAKKLFIKNRDFANNARVGRGLMDVYMYLGRYAEALKTGRKSLEYFRRKGARVNVAQMWTNIGNVYHRMDNNRLALRCYDRARSIFEKDGGIPLAIVQYNRANVYANLNQLKKAAALYQVAAGIYNRTGMKIAENQARYSLAYLYFLDDKYTQAFKTFEEVYTAFTRQGDVKSAAVTQLDLVEINLQLNQFGSAVMMGEKIIRDFHRLGMRYEEAKARYFVATAMIALKDFTRATEELKSAERLFVKERNKLWQGMVADAHCRIYISLKNYALARNTALKAAGLFKAGGDERRMTDAAIRQFEVLIKSGESQKVSRRTSAFLKRKLLAYQKYRLYYLLGQYHFGLNGFRKALFFFKRAAAIVENMIGGLYLDEIRFFFLMDKFDCYLMVVECLLKLNKTEDSFIYHVRALSLVNKKTLSEKSLAAEVPLDLLANRDRLRSALKKLAHPPREDRRAARAVSSQVAVEQKLWTNEKRIRAVLYPDKSETPANVSPRFDVTDFIRKRETLLSFVSTPHEMGVFCAGRNGVEYIRYDITPDEFRILLRKLHFIFEKAVYGLRDTERTRDVTGYYLSELYDILIKPLTSHIKGRELIILADGVFSQIPFAALQDGAGRFLKDVFRIKIITDPEDLKRRTDEIFNYKKSRNAVFAVPSDTLPAITTEGRSIKKSFTGTRMYLDNEADCGRFKAELKEADGFIHIATHASRSSENPLFSRILMSDGPFFPFDLFETGLKARLVALSGCQTAAPGLYYGNSFSLAKAFNQAGGKYVLATLWPVSDKLSMKFMTAFYRYLKKTNNVFASYEKAVNYIMDITDNPAFWSSFILLGV